MQIEASDIARLRSQVSRGEVILFTGAGFSLGAKDRAGRPIPSSGQLKKELWELCYPGEPFDTTCSLGDIYAAMLKKSKAELSTFLQTRLTIDPTTLPEYYKRIFDFPWLRCYTLNVDDLESAVLRQFGLERQPMSISGRETGVANLPGPQFSRPGLEVVHLNGMIPNAPEALTFSETQYAERIANQEPWYARCVVDITSRPVIFIGTVLNEALLWQHMELRKRRENLGRDLRPTSLLVTRELPRPRKDILRDLRINWLAGTAEEFANEVLAQLSAESAQGFAYIKQHAEGRLTGTIPVVSQLVAEHSKTQTEYLLGEEPQWSDILSGRAIERLHDQSLLKAAEEILAGRKPSTALAVTGTAGTGKSTALMSLAVRLSGAGTPVLWVDKDSLVTPAQMRSAVRSHTRVVLAIDDADMYGRELTNLLSDLVPGSKDFLFAFGTRSSKIDEILTLVRSDGRLSVHEHVVPPLEDADIDNLISVLDKNKRLGKLTGASANERRSAFRDQAGRQLLVAMIQATSSENFEEKAQNEYLELSGAPKYVYALIAVATSLRYVLTKDEVLLAQGDAHEESLVALDNLAAHHLIIAKSGANEYRSRHRVIADLVFDKLKDLGDLTDVLVGLAWALASKVGVPLDRSSRTARFLIRIMNHDFLLRTIGIAGARDVYARLENILASDYHYWLQRGSLEVEVGDVRKAENFLGSSKSLGPGDLRVDTAYAYMLMRKAADAPRDLHSKEFFEEGMAQLEAIIENSGRENEYPYHILGSQGLAWARRAIHEKSEQRALLEKLRDTVQIGLKQHPSSDKLHHLLIDLKKEILLTVTAN